MKLFVREITDTFIRENFRKLQDALNRDHPLRGFKHMEVKFDSAVENYKVAHGLGFVPKDIIRTRFTGTGILTFNFENFDSEFLNVSTNGACELRLLVGTYKQEL